MRPFSRDHWLEKRRQWALQQEAIKRRRLRVVVVLGVLVVAVLSSISLFIYSDDMHDAAIDYVRRIRQDLAAQPDK